jgi:hypothetical protein
MTQAAINKRAQEQRVKNLERALKEERTGLVAVAKAFLESSENPAALLRRLEVMARNAEDKRVPARTRDAIAHGHAVLQRAAEQTQGRPQGLFDPDVGHVPPARVRALTEAPVQQQIGLGFTESDPLLDVRAERAERTQGEQAIRDMIVECLRAKPLTDRQLEVECRRRLMPLKLTTVRQYRTELSRLGRLVSHDPVGGEPTWKLLEHKAA